jgi:thymidylate synthase ThyX
MNSSAKLPRGASRTSTAGTARADKLFARVFSEYGDDSVAQLGGAHIACEGVSNVLTKVLEWGRLMAYLEQSTRYVPYTDQPNGQWKYHVPAELDAQPPLRAAFIEVMDDAFETYARWIPAMEAHFRAKYPKSAQDSDGVYKSVIRAKALDTLRGLLPAATTSNVGLFGTGQAFEALAATDARAPTDGSPILCAPDAERVARSDPCISDARRSTGSRRPLDRLLRRNAGAVRTARRRARRRHRRRTLVTR